MGVLIQHGHRPTQDSLRRHILPKVNSFRDVAYPLRIHAGTDALQKLAEEVDRQRAKRAFIVCGQSVARHTNLLDRTKEALGERLAGVFDGAQAGSPLPSVENGVALAAEAGADLIVALGGGSAVVTTRAIIILLGEGGRAQDHATKYPPGIYQVYVTIKDYVSGSVSTRDLRFAVTN